MWPGLTSSALPFAAISILRTATSISSSISTTSPLTFAAAWNQLEATELLLSFGADPNVADKTGGTALMLAAQHGSKELVGLLLRHGANAKAKDNFGNTVLQHADWRKDGDGAAVRKLSLSRAGQRLPA